MCWTDSETIGLTEIKCPHNDCRVKTEFLLTFGKAYIVNKNLLKKKSLMKSLPPDIRKIIINTVTK